MATTTNQPYMNKSMNGIIVYDDGAGGSIEGGVITCNELETANLRADSLQAFTAGASCNLYTDVAGGASDIHIGNSGITLFVDSGIASVSPIYCSELHATNVYASTSVNTTFLDTPFTTDIPYLWPFVSGAITIGSATSPIIGTRVCTANNHLANKQYVDSIIPSSLLPLTNVWTGTSNTFNNKIVVTSVEAPSPFTNLTVFGNSTTSQIDFAPSLTTGILNMGNNMSGGNINIGATSIPVGNATIIIGNDSTGATNPLTLRTLGTLSLGSKSAVINIGETTTNGQISIGTGLTTGSITMGGTAQTGAMNIRTTGALNIGTASSAISIGTSTCPSIRIGNASTPSLQLNTPINPKYDNKYNATTGTPTGCIGEILAPTTFGATTDMVSPNNVALMATFTNLPVGVWLLYWNQRFTARTVNVVFTSHVMLMGTTSGGNQVALANPNSATRTLATPQDMTYLLTQIYCNTSATTDLYFTTYATFTGTLRAQLGSSYYIKAVRLA
jgi:hypothetical protein